ncbi:HNH endonuclease family protein [Agrococcus carbonis]|uniref:HNH endonuclease family protein n=1 Tax=Agrococcus carbonis TaxID=684552 RepID=UPI0012FAE452|nr:HNH endonuclease family protein [Agrococcus carbonis]
MLLAFALVGGAALFAAVLLDRGAGLTALLADDGKSPQTESPSPSLPPNARGEGSPAIEPDAEDEREPAVDDVLVDEADVLYQRALDATASLGELDGTQMIPPYRRDSFGDGWVDVDRNGCSTRNDVLERDLDAVTWLPDRRCVVATGTLQDPYTGASIPFFHDAVAPEGSRGSQGVQVDHIISLSAAHDGGAWAWTEAERIAFANDPETLLAVDGAANASKGDRGPSAWLPDDPGFWCDYSARYVEVAVEYGLAVERADRLMLQDVLQACV